MIESILLSQYPILRKIVILFERICVCYCYCGLWSQNRLDSLFVIYHNLLSYDFSVLDKFFQFR